MSTEQTIPANGFSYELTRALDVPAARVWRAWNTADQTRSGPTPLPAPSGWTYDRAAR
jgi:hypothetical protein